MKKIKWGILGPGKIANKFASDLRSVEGSELYAVASRSVEKARDFARNHVASKYYGSYQELMEDPEVDVVYIATPHVFHHEQTLLCLKHKKAVLCEKPFAMNRKQVEEMITYSRKQDTFLMEAMWTHFLPHFQYLKDLVYSGKYGQIRELKADFGFNAPFDKNSRLYNKNLGGGSLLDIGIYPVFMALSMLGKPKEINAQAVFCKTNIDEECRVIFHYENGVSAKLNSNINKETDTTATILLEKATIRLNSRFHEPTTISLITSEGEKTKDFRVNTYGYNYEAAHVAEMLRSGRKESNEMSFQKSLQLIDLLDKIREEIRLEY